MSDTYKLQVSPYLADGTMLNIQGDSPEEFAAHLSWVEKHAANIVNAVSAIKGITAVAEAMPVAATAVPEQGWQTNAATTPPPAFAQQSQPQNYNAPAPAAAASAAPGPVCQHGPMQWKQGQGAKGPWQAHMCNAQRNDPTKCDPIWLRKGEPGWR